MNHIEILIKSLRTFHPAFTYEILVCDNNSTDGSAEYLEKLEEVKLWRINERPIDDDFRERQKNIIHQYSLESYLHQHWLGQINKDNRTSHHSALNFLLNKVTAPLFATIDSDIEFLGSNWLEPFLLPFLINPNLSVVGVEEQAIKLKIRGFTGTTQRRMHPCFTLYRTKHAWEKQINWELDPEFDLRMLLIQKCLKEKIELTIPLGDTGYQILAQFNDKVFIDHDIFYSNIRHFLGTTVRNDYENETWNNWIRSLDNDEELLPLLEYANHNVDYARLGNQTIKPIQKYWSTKSPELPKNKKIKLIHA